MKTFSRPFLPAAIEFKGRVYTRELELDKDLIKYPEHLRIALEANGKVAVLVKVLAKNLRGKEDLHGKPYQPSTWIYTAPMQSKTEAAFDKMMGEPIPALENLMESIKTN